MSEHEIIKEIVLALYRCSEHDNCMDCRYEHECLEVFGKKLITDAVEEVASQCKAFNEFARANLLKDLIYADTDSILIKGEES